ncbi:MAG: hypothetical protein ACOYJ2_09160, partial [Rickettsiales bacterium]
MYYALRIILLAGIISQPIAANAFEIADTPAPPPTVEGQPEPPATPTTQICNSNANKQVETVRNDVRNIPKKARKAALNAINQAVSNAVSDG